LRGLLLFSFIFSLFLVSFPFFSQHRLKTLVSPLAFVDIKKRHKEYIREWLLKAEKTGLFKLPPAQYAFSEFRVERTKAGNVEIDIKGMTFWVDAESGLVLAFVNHYAFDKISEEVKETGNRYSPQLPCRILAVELLHLMIPESCRKDFDIIPDGMERIETHSTSRGWSVFFSRFAHHNGKRIEYENDFVIVDVDYKYGILNFVNTLQPDVWEPCEHKVTEEEAKKHAVKVASLYVLTYPLAREWFLLSGYRYNKVYRAELLIKRVNYPDDWKEYLDSINEGRECPDEGVPRLAWYVLVEYTHKDWDEEKGGFLPYCVGVYIDAVTGAVIDITF